MVGLISCLLAICAVAVTCMFAGRVAALTLNLVAVGIGAFLAPPALSFRVENTEDVVALLFQSIVGCVVAFRLPARKRRNNGPIADAQPRLTLARTSNYRLLTIARRAMETDADLKDRLADVEVEGELQGNVALSEAELDRLISSLLRTAFTHTNVRQVGMYTGRQPTLDRITLVAGYDPSPTLPRVRSLGRPETQCQVLQMDHLPPHCSATWFDNGYDYVYQIAIYRNPRTDL